MRLDVLYLSPSAWRMSPQTGEPRSYDWADFVDLFSEPLRGTRKDQFGAWSPAKYVGNVRRNDNLIHACAIVIDVDKAGGEVDRVAEVLSRVTCLIHETFSSTVQSPRCRIVLPLQRPCSRIEYVACHEALRGRLRVRGVEPDEGAKDASRASYVPVRSPGDPYAFRTVEATPIDAQRIAAAHPAPVVPLPAPAADVHDRSAYVRGAIARERDRVAQSSPGDRHYALLCAGNSLARLELGLTYDEVVAALLPAWSFACGGKRLHEARRTLRDCWIRSKRG